MSLWGAFETPPTWVVMARPDAGKTWDSLNTFDTRCLVIGEPKGYDPVAHGNRGLGIRLNMGAWTLTRDKGWQGGQCVSYRLFEEIVHLLEEYVSVYENVPLEDRPFYGLVVDDLSLLLKNQKQKVWADIPERGRGTFRRWEILDDLLTRFYRAADMSGMVSYLSMHYEDYREADPKLKRSERLGGPQTVGPKITNEICYRSSTIGLVDYASTRWPRQTAYKAPLGLDPKRQLKDRHNLLRGERPFCTRELLRVEGYAIPEPFDGFDAVVERVAQLIRERGGDVSAVKRTYAEVVPALVEKGFDVRVAHRVAFNGIAREELTRSGYGLFHDILEQARSGATSNPLGKPPTPTTTPSGSTEPNQG